MSKQVGARLLVHCGRSRDVFLCSTRLGFGNSGLLVECRSSESRVGLFEWGQFCFKISWISCFFSFFPLHHYNHRGCGHSLFPQSSILFYKCPPAVRTPNIRGEKKMFLILQRANQNIPYYVCDASNPWCGLEFSFSPQKTAGWHSQYIQHTRLRRG